MFRKLERTANRVVRKISFILTICFFGVYILSLVPSNFLFFSLGSICILLLTYLIFKINWSSEKFIDKRGYVVLKKHNELEHRWVAMKILKRDLKSNEVVHHVNGEKTENSIENLCLLDRDKHEHFHSWLRWKKEKDGKYPSISDQKLTLVNEYDGLLLENFDSSPIFVNSIHSYYGKKEKKARENTINESDDIKVKIVKAESCKTKFSEVSDDMRRGLFTQLREERKRLSEKFNVPPYLIFDDKTLRKIAELMPDSEYKMLEIGGVGQIKVDKYSGYFLGIIRKFKEDNDIY